MTRKTVRQLLKACRSDRASSFLLRLIAVVVIAAVILALWRTGAWESLWELFSNRERVRRLVESSRGLAPVVYVLLLVAQAVLAPLPAPVVAAAGGYAFGTFKGFLLTWLGALLGGAASFWISRLLGRRSVARSERIKKLDRNIERHGALVIFLLRLVPLISFDAISYAAGLSGLSFWKFLAATALGIVPGTFVFVYMGGAPAGIKTYAALGVLALAAIAAYAYFRKMQRE